MGLDLQGSTRPDAEDMLGMLNRSRRDTCPYHCDAHFPSLRRHPSSAILHQLRLLALAESDFLSNWCLASVIQLTYCSYELT